MEYQDDALNHMKKMVEVAREISRMTIKDINTEPGRLGRLQAELMCEAIFFEVTVLRHAKA
jgi:hypothetical protein